MGASVLTITAISIDRFFLTVYPIKYRVSMNGKLIVVLSACTWLIPPGPTAKVFLFPSANANVNVMVLFGMNTFAGTAIVFSSVVYGFTYYKLKKQSRNLALGNISNRQEQARVIKEKQFLRTIILIACIQIACVVPKTIMFNEYIFETLFTHGRFALIWSRIFAVLFDVNFSVNPLVYVWRLPNYRRTFYLLYCCRRQDR
ncbi:lysophosphatidic acid receptor 4-like [Dendronephthya gigantea]|uniref:lysophosphatidic acid receptor 4-like n=1 Tax=Dendronephthya gigantea TaxID=151771 RepID=UPI00106D90F6|nr:lysophosphatidic acid receptor 4-like [Dendronephthya gigantea]